MLAQALALASSRTRLALSLGDVGTEEPLPQRAAPLAATPHWDPPGAEALAMTGASSAIVALRNCPLWLLASAPALPCEKVPARPASAGSAEEAWAVGPAEMAQQGTGAGQGEQG